MRSQGNKEEPAQRLVLFTLKVFSSFAATLIGLSLPLALIVAAIGLLAHPTAMPCALSSCGGGYLLLMSRSGSRN